MCIPVIRLGLFVLISGGFLTLLHYTSQNISHTSQIAETWNKMDYQIMYTNNHTILWTERLTQGWTNINFYADSGDFMFSQNIFYDIVPDEILRIFTFNVIRKRTFNLDIMLETRSLSVNDMILTLQAVNLRGIVYNEGIYYSVWDNYALASNEVTNYTIAFYIINITLWIGIVAYIIFLFLGINSTINENIISLCDKMFPPLNDLKSGLISTLFHTFIIWIFTFLLMAASYYSNYMPVKTVIYWTIVVYMFTVFIFIVPYYFQYKNTSLAYMFNVVTCITILINIMYLINVYLWLILGMVIDVINVAPFLIIFTSIIIYFINLPSEINSIRNTLKAKITKNNADRDLTSGIEFLLEEYGFTTKNVIVPLVWSLLLIFLFSVWLIVFWYIFNMTNSFGQIISSLTVPILAYTSKINQIDNINSSIDDKVKEQGQV